MKQIAPALPHSDGWRYPVGPYAPLLLKKRVEGGDDLNRIAVVDLVGGEAVQKSHPRLLADFSLLMQEVVKIDDLIY